MASAATLTFFCLKIAFGNLSSNKIIFLTIIGILSLYTQGEGELWRGHEQYPHSTDWTYILWWPHLLFPIYARLNIFRKAKDGKQVRRDATERDDPVEAVEHSDNLQRVARSMIAHPGNRYTKEKEQYVPAICCHQNADRLWCSPGGSRSPRRTWPRGTLIQWTRNQPLTICHRWWWSLWWCCSCWSRRRCWSPSRWDPWLAGPSLFSLNPAMLHTRYFVILGINCNKRQNLDLTHPFSTNKRQTTNELLQSYLITLYILWRLPSQTRGQSTGNI